LTAVPICDGHDSAIITVNLELVRHGVEVVYLGYHRSVRDIVRAAIQEDVQAVGLSSYNGGHIEFFDEVLAGLRRCRGKDIELFGGGGGTITTDDARLMKRRGVHEIFAAGTSLTGMAQWVRTTYGPRPNGVGGSRPAGEFAADLELARKLSQVEARGGSVPVRARDGASGSSGARVRNNGSMESSKATPVIGITGPGGAGKTTLIDELVLRFLARRPTGRLAILAHDPGAPGKGALLGDRATMVNSQHDRVFMRSLATTGHAGGLSSVSRGCLQVLRHAGFDLVLVESSGIGQEDLPFRRGLVDRQILVLSPEYGGGLQLQKIQMLDAADIVVVNKSDRAGARTALAEIEQRLAHNQRGQKLMATVAKRHRDPGADRLFEEVMR
jgi:methylmalonyl-CoA mutase